jgi:hypothetical protein
MRAMILGLLISRSGSAAGGQHVTHDEIADTRSAELIVMKTTNVLPLERPDRESK